MGMGCGTLCPVSYTHLDVYKRQVPCDVDEDDTVTDEQRLVAVLDLHPLELLRVVRGRVAEAVFSSRSNEDG